MKRHMKSPHNLWQALLVAHLLSGNSLAWSQATVSGRPEASVRPPVEYALADVEIGLERTVCFGTCPSYTLRIFGDGRVVYEGRKYVRVEGKQESTIDKSHVLNILHELYRVYFFDMQGHYEYPEGITESDGIVRRSLGKITDLPTQIVKVRIGAYEKQVSHYYGGPPELIELIDLIDLESGSEQWIK